MVEGDDFMEIVRNNWNIEDDAKLMMRLCSKLKRLQPILRGPSRKISYRAHNLQVHMSNLAQAQQKINGDMFNTEYIQDVKHFTNEILITTKMEEIFLMEKSKVTWLKLRDGNNAYFHTIVKEKNKQIGMHRMEDSNGNMLKDFKETEKEILKFYGELVGRVNIPSYMWILRC